MVYDKGVILVYHDIPMVVTGVVGRVVCSAGVVGMMERQALIGDVRGIGLLMGIELVTDRETKAR